MNPEIHNSIVQIASLLNVDWHDRQNRVIFTTNEKQPRRVYMFRINSRDEETEFPVAVSESPSGNINVHFIRMPFIFEKTRKKPGTG